MESRSSCQRGANLSSPSPIESARVAPLFDMDESDFASVFAIRPSGEPIGEGCLRSAAIVLGNQRDPSCLASTPQGSERCQSLWSAERQPGPWVSFDLAEARAWLMERDKPGTDESVRSEISSSPKTELTQPHSLENVLMQHTVAHTTANWKPGTRLSRSFRLRLSGYSDTAMRLIARRMGASYTLCEVMLDKLILQVRKRQRTHHLMHVDDEGASGSRAIDGGRSLQFGPAALRLVEQGFDVIDINFGCPVKKVLGRCRGGFHLSQPAVALEIVSRVREAIPPHIPVTVKMRRGIDDSQESRENFFTIFDGAL